jgi:hypothetical protein
MPTYEALVKIQGGDSELMGPQRLRDISSAKGPVLAGIRQVHPATTDNGTLHAAAAPADIPIKGDRLSALKVAFDDSKIKSAKVVFSVVHSEDPEPVEGGRKKRRTTRRRTSRRRHTSRRR